MKLIDALQTVRDRVTRAGYHPHAGICTEIKWSFPGRWDRRVQLLAEFSELAKGWPKYSGDRTYPIPGGEGAYVAHMQARTLWTGEQRALRLELLDWCIEQLGAGDV